MHCVTAPPPPPVISISIECSLKCKKLECTARKSSVDFDSRSTSRILVGTWRTTLQTTVSTSCSKTTKKIYWCSNDNKNLDALPLGSPRIT
eukprot:m.311864 g.311864  ORF g.311864 m.311864 type:complete len:91 (-) comp16482_c0_seq66:2198-2470(-)